MDKREATMLVQKVLQDYESLPRRELADKVGTHTFEVTGSSGTTYQVEVIVMQDSRQARIHIVASIDDMGWRAFFPLCKTLIVDLDDSYASGAE